MLLPGLEPHHTRQGFGSRSRLYVELYATEPDDFIQSQSGLWNLPADISEWDRWRGEELLHRQADVQEEADMKRHAHLSRRGARILGRSMTTASGCIVGGLRGNQTPEEWTLFFAEREWGGPVFTQPDELPYVRTCDEPECYNTRHFDIEFGRATLRERKVELNPDFYTEQEDGRIKTIWGDVLPSVEDSLAYFIEFQKRNYPFVPFAQSPLTPSSMSQIRFHPVTGCWESWSYYCKPDDNLNWQFDGYGRLYQRLESFIDKDTGEIVEVKRRGHWLAHRVVWLATGHHFRSKHVLNHLCAYRRCCNPLHLEQVDNGTNVVHGRRAQDAIKNYYDTHPDQQRTRFIHPRELKDVSEKVLALYHNAA